MAASFDTTTAMIAHVRGKFPHMIFAGRDYSKADQIADLERIEQQHADRVKELEDRIRELEAKHAGDVLWRSSPRVITKKDDQ